MEQSLAHEGWQVHAPTEPDVDGPLAREDGIWVIAGVEPMTGEQTDTILRSIREERDRSNLGDLR